MDQDIKSCFWCGMPAVVEHHVFKRSTAPERIDDPTNKVPLCAVCHNLTETDDRFYHALQKIVNFRPKNFEMFMMAFATLESLFTGKPIEYVTPGMCDHYLTLAQGGYAFYSERMGFLEQIEAKYFIENKNDEMSNKELEMAFKVTEEGQEKISVSRRLKTLEKTMSALRSKMARFREERFNQNH